MCGLAGFLDLSPRRSADDLTMLVDRMTQALHHRGPDSGGNWIDAEQGIALGHRRLAIVDLSPAGHQPMVSSCGRYVIAYNGEVYSHDEMRRELAALGRPFRGHSDTEVIVEGCAVWGVEETVRRLIGMFAFALWDRQARCLTLVRDRLGIKPLYWGIHQGMMMFGSELKALRTLPDWDAEIDRGALAAYMRHNYVPAPSSIYRGIHKLPPGHILTLPHNGQPQVTAYWRCRDVALAAKAGRRSPADAEAVTALDNLLHDAVGRRMLADVPLGAFLSGGVDSSTVVAIMQAQSNRPVKTFSIGFTEAGFNEAEHAKAVAAHLGTEHTELYVQPADALAVIPQLPHWYDEPFADSSQVPTYLVSQMTRRHVTVALSGDGGDELFAGYSRYFVGERLWRRLSMLPAPARRMLAAAMTAMPATLWDGLFGMMPQRWRIPQPADKMQKLAGVIGVNDADGLYRRLVSHWQQPDQIVLNARESRGVLWDDTVARDFPDFVERMQFLDTVTYLPDDILTKVDRASMAVALEARVPLLDHRLVEFAWSLPSHFKIRDGQGKWLLRQVLYRYVPKNLIERPKMGFAVPIGTWLRGPLRDWAECLLAEERLTREGYFDPAMVRRLWREHLSGARNWQYLLWNVLMFGAWLETQSSREAPRGRR